MIIPGIIASQQNLAPYVYRYYRVYITQTVSSSDATLWEIEFRGSVGGADLSGTGPRSSIIYNYWNGNAATDPLNAFNGQISSGSRWDADGSTPPYWLGWDFGTPTAIREIALYPYNSIGDWATDFQTQGSNDGVLWDTIDTYTDYNQFYTSIEQSLELGVIVDTFYKNNFEGVDGAAPSATDDTSLRTMSTSGSVTLDDTYKKFGTTSLTGNTDATLDTIETDIATQLSVTYSTPLTFAGWFRVNRASGDTEFEILAINNNTKNLYEARVNNAGASTFEMAYRIGTGTDFSGLATLSYDTWYHIELSFGAADVDFYIDGTLDKNFTRDTSFSAGDVQNKIVQTCGGSGRQIWWDSTIFRSGQDNTSDFTPPETAY